jgi:hypothetical protein
MKINYVNSIETPLSMAHNFDMKYLDIRAEIPHVL